MNILSKLENITIQAIDRFPPEDMEYCKQEECVYQEIFHIYSEMAFILEDTNAKLRGYPSCPYIRTLDENKDRVSDCNEVFINNICGYFRKKYAVTVDEPNWEASYDENGRKYTKERHDIVPLQYILESVYEQMGGMSFEEKAFYELKESAREAVTAYTGDSKYTISNAKLVVDDFYNSRKDRVFERYMATVAPKHHSFFKALTHFEYGYYGIAQKYRFLCEYRIDEKEGIYDKHPISSAVINMVRVFKNGKVEIAFKSYGTAVKFMEKYFTGIPQQAA